MKARWCFWFWKEGKGKNIKEKAEREKGYIGLRKMREGLRFWGLIKV